MDMVRAVSGVHPFLVMATISKSAEVSAANSVRVLIDAWAMMTGRFDGHDFACREGVTTTFANRPLSFFNLSTLDRALHAVEDLSPALATARARALRCGHPSMLAICGEWAPEGWEDLAAEAGWLRSMQLSGMATDRLRPERRPQPGLDYRQVDDPVTGFDLGLVNALAYGMAPQDFECLSEMSLWANGAFGIVGYDVGRPVTGAATFVFGDLIYVAMVASVPGLHGRGFAEAAMRRAIEAAEEATGAKQIWLHATEAGAPLYRSMGFADGAGVTMLHLAAP
jgi:GNAT superfamily N-acetyltransferase